MRAGCSGEFRVFGRPQGWNFYFYFGQGAGTRRWRSADDVTREPRGQSGSVCAWTRPRRGRGQLGNGNSTQSTVPLGRPKPTPGPPPLPSFPAASELSLHLISPCEISSPRRRGAKRGRHGATLRQVAVSSEERG